MSAPTDTVAGVVAAVSLRRSRVAIWLPGLVVALGAAVATAHGLYEVARAAGAPALIAGLYPLITDGLALVAYAATTRLTDTARRYAWTVVVLAAGLSGLAQASYLAGGVATAPAALRFGVGAWPAIAAAIVAHLLFLLATDAPSGDRHGGQRPAPVQAHVQPDTGHRAVHAGGRLDAALPAAPSSAPDAASAEDLAGTMPTAAAHPEVPPPAGSSARDRAHRVARAHHARHGALPTARHLADLADVSRGTAGEALKDLRAQPSQLHIVRTAADERTPQ